MIAILGVALMAASEVLSFEADVLGTGVTRCAIEMASNGTTTLQPIFLAGADVEGEYSFVVTSVSNGGRSVTRQANRFSAGRVDGPTVTLGTGAHIEAGFEVTDAHGMALCSIKVSHPANHLVQRSTSHSGGMHG